MSSSTPKKSSTFTPKNDSVTTPKKDSSSTPKKNSTSKSKGKTPTPTKHELGKKPFDMADALRKTFDLDNLKNDKEWKDNQKNPWKILMNINDLPEAGTKCLAAFPDVNKAKEVLKTMYDGYNSATRSEDDVNGPRMRAVMADDEMSFELFEESNLSVVESKTWIAPDSENKFKVGK